MQHSAMVFINSKRKVPLTTALIELHENVMQLNTLLLEQLEALDEVCEIVGDMEIRKIVKAYARAVDKYEEKLSALQIK